MNSNGRPPDPTGVEMEHFQENRRRFPMEGMIPYAGLHVAWNLEGTEIVASGVSMEEVEDKVVAAGMAPNRVVYGYIDRPDVSYIGGLCDFPIK